MSSYKSRLLVMLTCFILFLQPMQTSILKDERRIENSSIPADVDIFNVMPDPQLQSTPSAEVNGTSDEFQYNHQAGAMELAWTHSPGTELDYSSSDDSVYPSFNDFVYFSQTFNWSFEERPKDVRLELNCSFDLSGSFQTEDAGSLMFRFYFWLVDSSGNWEQVYHSTPPYLNETMTKYVDLNYWQTSAAFEGMIENDLGLQEDPVDELSWRIGLAPTNDFLEYMGSNPWEDYNGSVLMTVTSMILYIVREVEPDPATHLTPLYNVSYGSVLSEIASQTVLEGSTPLRDEVEAMQIDENGNIFVTGESAINYETYQQTGIYGHYQFLIKYNPTLQQLWSIRNANQTSGRAICIHDDYLYTTGFMRYPSPQYRDLIVTKWTTTGNKVWETEWSFDYDQVGVAVGVHNDGSIYVIASDYNIVAPPGHDRSNLLKFDSDGTFLWNKTIQLSTIFDVAGELQVFEDCIVYYIDGAMICLDLNGNLLWDKATWGATTDKKNTIYAITAQSAWIKLSEIDLDGNITWTNTYEIIYPTGWVEFLNSVDVALTPEDELYVLFQGSSIDYSYRLNKYSTDGTLLQSWTIGSNLWPSFPLMMMEVSPNGYMYLSLNVFGSDFWTQAYAMSNGTLPVGLVIDSVTLTIVGGVIGVILVVAVVIYKKKTSVYL